jgi:hypothetical protein
MSLLNLNTPQEKNPGSKKSSKLWMGAGLLVAVLGIGSTFASNITLNQPGGTTEFGQGVTQTVYCGGDQSVTITPISTYVNTSVGSPTGGSAEVSFTGRFANRYSSDFWDFTETSAPTTTVNGKTGWWLTDINTSSRASNQSLETARTNASKYVFSERQLRSGSSSKWGYYEVQTVTTSKVVISPAVEPTPGPTTPASFKVGGVVISDIPSACAGKDFVVSAYAETGGTPLTLISKDAEAVKEAAVYFSRVPGSAVSSTDRTAQVTSTLVSATQTLSSIKIVFNTGSGTALTADNLYKIVVETQEDAIA